MVFTLLDMFIKLLDIAGLQWDTQYPLRGFCIYHILSTLWK